MIEQCALPEPPPPYETHATLKVIEQTGFGSLSVDIIYLVYQFLSAGELSRSACTNGRWHRVAENRSLWKALGVKRWELSLHSAMGLSGFNTPNSFAGGSSRYRPPGGTALQLARDLKDHRRPSSTGRNAHDHAGYSLGQGKSNVSPPPLPPPPFPLRSLLFFIRTLCVEHVFAALSHSQLQVLDCRTSSLHPMWVSQ